MGKINDMVNHVKNFFDKWLDRIKNIFKPKLVENLTVGQEDLAKSLIQSQNKLKEMANSEVWILSDMEKHVQQYCTELVAMKVDGYERYQELLGITPINLNSITIQERFEKILNYLKTNTVPNTKTPERIKYENDFSDFFNEVFDNHLDKFPKNSKNRIMLPSAISPYIDKDNPIHTETMKSIKESVRYKKNKMIDHLQKIYLPYLKEKKVTGKITEQDVSPEDYNNTTLLFRKWMEEYSKQPWAQIVRHEDIPDNIAPDTYPYDWIEKTDHNIEKMIQSVVVLPPLVSISYTTKDSPSEIKVRDLDMKTFARHSFEFQTV